MRGVLIANAKGGTGKTTIATSLAAAYAKGGYCVALADADRQGSSLGWCRRRPETEPPIIGLDWRKGPDRVPKRVERLIVNSPAALEVSEFRALLKRADAVLVPVLPSAFDRVATLAFAAAIGKLRPVRKNRKPVALVINRARMGSRRLASLQAAFAEAPFPLVAELLDRAIYADLAEAGLGVHDRANKAARAAQQDWTSLITFIETREYLSI